MVSRGQISVREEGSGGVEACPAEWGATVAPVAARPREEGG